MEVNVSTGNPASGSNGNSSAGDAPPVNEHPSEEQWQAALKNLQTATLLEQANVRVSEGRPSAGQPAAAHPAVGEASTTRASPAQTSTAQVGSQQPAALGPASGVQGSASSSTGQPGGTAISPAQPATTVSGTAKNSATDASAARTQQARPAATQAAVTQPGTAVSGSATEAAAATSATRPQLIRPAVTLRAHTQPIASDASISRPQLEGGIPVDFGVTFRIDPPASGVCLRIASMVFDVTVSDKDFLAAFKNDAKMAITLGDCISTVPDALKSLSLTPKGAVLDYHAGEKNEPNTVLFGLSIQLQDPFDTTKSGFRLSQLPFVGDRIPAGHDFGIDDVGLLYSSQTIADKLPDAAKIKDATGILLPSVGALTKGIHFSTTLNVGGSPHALSSPGPSGGKELVAEPKASGGDGIMWMNVDKTLGPIALRRVGGSYKDGQLWVLLDVSVCALGLTVGVDGLGVGIDVSAALAMEWKKLVASAAFTLSGLGIDYSNTSVEIGGEFLRTETNHTESYDGGAVIKTKQFALSAIGSYTTIENHPSMFIYGVLDYPLGGPSFFFVTGLAAGFGYNRKLNVPPVEKVSDFPLIKFANNGPGGKARMSEVLKDLRDYIPPSSGDIWLAIGIKFTSFKLIDSFALLALSFGHLVEIDLLGTSHVVVPPESPETLAEVNMQFKASLVPELGELKIDAVVSPGSYILSKDCHLTGGFAMYCWFLGDLAGDFVQTLGGYHPAFRAPAHYPQVPRLGFQWKVDEYTSLSGGGYYALTSHALMAGVSLSANYSDDRLKAWFHLQADFLIAWKPFHYDASMEVDLGASYRLFGNTTISVDLSVGLHIWGPEFAGTAHVNLYICSFNVAFGAASSPAEPAPLEWDEPKSSFKSSFLPANNQICSVNVKSGLLRTIKADDGNPQERMVINAKDFALVTNSVIPSTSGQSLKPDNRMNKELTQETQAADKDGKALTAKANLAFGIAPMALPSFTSTHGIKVTRLNSVRATEDATTRFQFIPILKSAPTALWGVAPNADVNGAKFVENTLAGFEIRPANPPTPGQTHAIERSNLRFEVHRRENMYEWGRTRRFTPGDEKPSKALIEKSIGASKMNLLTTLGFSQDKDVALDKSAISLAFVVPPQVGATSTP